MYRSTRASAPARSRRGSPRSARRSRRPGSRPPCPTGAVRRRDDELDRRRLPVAMLVDRIHETRQHAPERRVVEAAGLKSSAARRGRSATRRPRRARGRLPRPAGGRCRRRAEGRPHGRWATRTVLPRPPARACRRRGSRPPRETRRPSCRRPVPSARSPRARGAAGAVAVLVERQHAVEERDLEDAADVWARANHADLAPNLGSLFTAPRSTPSVVESMNVMSEKSTITPFAPPSSAVAMDGPQLGRRPCRSAWPRTASTATSPSPSTVSTPKSGVSVSVIHALTRSTSYLDARRRNIVSLVGGVIRRTRLRFVEGRRRGSEEPQRTREVTAPRTAARLGPSAPAAHRARPSSSSGGLPPLRRASSYSWSRVRPRGALRCARTPPRRPDEMSSRESRDGSLARPSARAPC